MPPPCCWCDASGTLLCDGPAAEPGRTCDAPLCRRHALLVSRYHVHARPWTPGLSGWHTTDLCPDCVARTELAAGR